MSVRATPADEQLTVYCSPEFWRLHGPDGVPVAEVRNRTIYYHPLFGQWRDLPPGDRISCEGVDSIQVRWDGGWAVGLVLAPGGVWRRLVRWTDSREIGTADDVARALSDLLGCPLHADTVAAPAVIRVGYGRQPGTAATAADDVPQRRPEAVPAVTASPLAATGGRPSVTTAPPLKSPVYTVTDVSDVRLPLRLGGGAVLLADGDDRLRLKLPTGARGPAAAIVVLGLVALLVFVAVIWALRGGVPALDPVLGLALGGGVLLLFGLVGMLLLARWDRRLQKQVVFDRAAGKITIIPAEVNQKSTVVAVTALHGIRLRGAAIRRRSHLAYQRTVALILDKSDVPVFVEARDTTLPPDPAVMPSLVALRHHADEQGGPSLARAAARVLAWFLGVPLADE
jgi:hypothetical protein